MYRAMILVFEGTLMMRWSILELMRVNFRNSSIVPLLVSVRRCLQVSCESIRNSEIIEKKMSVNILVHIFRWILDISSSSSPLHHTTCLFRFRNGWTNTSA